LKEDRYMDNRTRAMTRKARKSRTIVAEVMTARIITVAKETE
jgi:hypothetical protein